MTEKERKLEQHLPGDKFLSWKKCLKIRNICHPLRGQKWQDF